MTRRRRVRRPHRYCEDVGRVVRFHTSAVKDADFNIASAQRQDFFVDECVHIGNLFDGGDFACADCPDGFVGDGDVFGIQPLQDGKLMGDDFVFFAGFALFEAFADAQ